MLELNVLLTNLTHNGNVNYHPVNIDP